MTAHAMKGDRDRCLAAGMDGYLSKPINGQDLIEAVERAAGKTAAAAEAVFSFDEAMARLDGRRELFQEMVAFFFQDSPAVMAAVRSGLQDRSAAALDRHAHKLMGTLLYLGAEPALQAARRVEIPRAAGRRSDRGRGGGGPVGARNGAAGRGAGRLLPQGRARRIGPSQRRLTESRRPVWSRVAPIACYGRRRHRRRWKAKTG